MTSSSQLREGDVDLMLRVIEDAHHDDPDQAMPWALLDGLQLLIPCDDSVTYQVHDHANRRSILCQGVEADGTRVLDGPQGDGEADAFWTLWWQSHCSFPQRSGDLRSVIHTYDFFPSRQAWHDDPMRNECLVDVTDAMIVSLPAPAGFARRMVLFRTDGVDFTERDRQVAALLRPHLQEIWLDAERRRAGVPQLTAREWQILGMTAAGLSYPEIAAALFVSVGTVRKHMEHVRERLGVHSRHAAVVKAMPHAPAGVPRQWL